MHRYISAKLRARSSYVQRVRRVKMHHGAAHLKTVNNGCTLDMRRQTALSSGSALEMRSRKTLSWWSAHEMYCLKTRAKAKPRRWSDRRRSRQKRLKAGQLWTSSVRKSALWPHHLEWGDVVQTIRANSRASSDIRNSFYLLGARDRAVLVVGVHDPTVVYLSGECVLENALVGAFSPSVVV